MTICSQSSKFELSNFKILRRQKAFDNVLGIFLLNFLWNRGANYPKMEYDIRIVDAPSPFDPSAEVSTTISQSAY